MSSKTRPDRNVFSNVCSNMLNCMAKMHDQNVTHFLCIPKRKANQDQSVMYSPIYAQYATLNGQNVM